MIGCAGRKKWRCQSFIAGLAGAGDDRGHLWRDRTGVGLVFGGGGCLVSSAVGFVGALLGNWLVGQLSPPTLLALSIDGQPFPIVWSIVGSVILVAIAALFARRRTVVV